MDLKPIAEGLLNGVNNPRPFANSQYPYPISQSLLGQESIDGLGARVKHLAKEDLESQLITLLVLAEAAEASQEDRNEFFIGDRELRARLVRVNTTAGWALLWGDNGERTAELAKLLHEQSFQVYAVLPPEAQSSLGQGKRLGSRATSPIYFFQALIRYPHIYGRVALGDPHEISDFIQDYGPGVVFVAKEALSPTERALLLGGLALGIPTVVPSTLQLDYGSALRADSPAEMVEAALKLPNLRLRRRLGLHTNLPFNFDYSFIAEEIPEGISIGGTDASSFVVINTDKGDGIEVTGETGPDIGIEISMGDPRVDITMTDYLEEFAAKLPAFIEGVFAEVREGCPMICWRADLAITAEHIGHAYYAGLKAHFHIDRLKVRLVFSPDQLGKMRAEAASFRDRRRRVIATSTEETEPYLYHCIRCHSFALEHACVITPERPPQCGSRSWQHIKTRAILSAVDSSGLSPWKGANALQGVIWKGTCLDEAKGEFQGANDVVRQLTEGRTRRVFLHSIFQHPHTACSCFQGVAFHIPAVDGIGLVDNTFRGRTPDGRNWDDIANAVAGKQAPGYAGFGKEYLRSAKFLQGDGGWHRVVWMPAVLKERFAADKAWIASETDVSNIEELQTFLNRKLQKPGEPKSTS